MAQKKDDPGKFFGDVMELAAQLGWRRTSLTDIAEATGETLESLHKRFGSKQGILTAFADHIDELVLHAGPAEADGEISARDRLFEIIMRRFDALQPYKEGLRQIAREGGGGDLVDLICGAQHLARSMGWMLEAAGIGASGIAGAVRTKGLAAIYLSTLRTWLRDDTEDMSRTMAALDRHLARAERFASMQGPFGRRRYQPGPPPDSQPAAPA
jgi:AcrR family transcriptional regulator